VLAAGVVGPLFLWGSLPVGSEAASLSSIRSKIESTEQRIEEHRHREQVLTTDIQGLTHRIDRLQEGITALTIRETRVQASLDKARAQLTATQQDLREQRARRVRLQARLTVGRHTLARRLVELYESDQPSLISVVLNARGFEDLLERSEFLSRISEQDRRIIENVHAAREEAKVNAARLAELEVVQRKATALVLDRRNEIDGVRSKLVARRTTFDSAKAQRWSALNRTRDAREALEHSAAHLRRDEARITGTLVDAGSQFPASAIGALRPGQLLWPVNGPVTSPYGPRILNGVAGFHPGIDIGAAEGTPIRAAAAGVVALIQSTAASGGFGNFTCVQHTRVMSTCYAHQSRIATSVGAHVSQGQVIGYVGNTGFSFGAHLDLEVRINGRPVNPLTYL
jgi:murein DD-endopeptidase MepM/ murein hydrolase activator NlpD